jgi:hypothetical protein
LRRSSAPSKANGPPANITVDEYANGFLYTKTLIIAVPRRATITRSAR